MLDRVKHVDRVLTITPTARVERLRQRYLDTRDKAVIDMGRIITRAMKETEAEPRVTQGAKALAATARETPVNIYPDELFVGWLWSEPRGTEVGVSSFGLERELDTLSTREYTPFLISEEVKRELREEIFPYWRTRYWAPAVPPEATKLGIKHAAETKFLPHIAVNYEKVLKKGLLGVMQDAEDRLARLDPTDPVEVKKIPFLNGVIIALEGASELGLRFAAEARRQASTEKDSNRKSELLKIAEVCDQVPANPARTFYEALQSVWFTHMILGWEVGFHGGISPGRADQYLYPYYANDIEEGRLTEDAAQELLDCWCMRYSQMFTLSTEGGARFMSNHTSGHHIGIGGMKADGSDASNALSYMLIESMMHTPGMVEPTLGLLVHSRTPESLLIKACQLTALGGGYPQFINHDVLVDNLLARGGLMGGAPVTLEIAREHGGCVGCHEPSLHTMESGWNAAGTNLPIALETVLYNGTDRTGEKQVGIETGDPTQFKTFEDLKDAIKEQVAFMVKRASMSQSIGEQKLLPTVFASALVEDCIENGVSKEEGGARFSVGAISMIGSVDVGNSLAVIKNLVFDEEKITMAQLCEALRDNFEGHEEIHNLCMEVPKFGNGNDYVDEQVKWLTHFYTEEVKQYKTTYGGPKLVVQVPLSSYVPVGLMVGALPSGRYAGEPLSDGVSPTRGSDLEGPTAVINSVGKINNAEVSLGQTLNLKLDPEVFQTEDGYKRLADLIRVFVDQKLDHIQINVVSSETLIAAQKEPENYRDLVVKVAGYNARFVDLHREVQDSIIARTEHGL
jgi:formate C-acetyltransferase